MEASLGGNAPMVRLCDGRWVIKDGSSRLLGFRLEGRVIFNISGNKFRLVVRINYAYRVVYVRFVGTHEEYVETV